MYAATDPPVLSAQDVRVIAGGPARSALVRRLAVQVGVGAIEAVGYQRRGETGLIQESDARERDAAESDFGQAIHGVLL